MSQASTDRRHAVLIGIDAYPALPERYQLRGCVRDVESIDGVLREGFTFPSDSIRRLVDQAATRREILRALDDLVARARPGDVVVIFFSGHGSQVRDPTRPSGWSESIVPHDSGRGEHPNRDILDLEVRQRIAAIERRGLYATLIFDACFSGGISRRDETATARTVERDPRPVDHSRAALHPGSGFRGQPRVVAPAGVPHVLITACGEDELSWETAIGEDDARQGALTFHLCRELAAAPAGASYRRAFATVARRVSAERPDQHPRLEGARERQIFGRREIRDAADPGGWVSDGSDPVECYQRFLDTREHPPGCQLAGCLEAVMQLRDPGGQWYDIVRPIDGTPPTLTDGDRVAVALRHRHDTPLYIYLFDLGLRGRIAQVFPPPGGAQRLQPGHSLIIGRDTGWELQLALPEEPTLELEHFKIVASSHELDLGAVEHPGFDTPRTAVGPTTRRALDKATAVDWVSLVLPFRLQSRNG